jgi:hypothetical protein
VALGAFGFLFAEDQRLKLLLAIFADVLEDGHEGNSRKKIAIFYLKSKCGHFANTRTVASVRAAPLVAGGTRADSGQLFDWPAF